MKLQFLNTESDKWIIEYSSNIGDNVALDFAHLPNDWFKKIHKQITKESIMLERLSVHTIYRYNYSLKHFTEFLNEYRIELKNYEDLKHRHIQMFIFYLKQQNISNATRSVIMSSLKWIITHGQVFEYEGFPKNPLFDGDESRVLRVEDTLKTKSISDYVMIQIEKALKKEKNTLVKSLLEIGIDTGLRIGEVLELKLGCMTEDFTGKPVLHVESSKNKTERFIPVSQRVKRSINTLEKLSEKGRKALEVDTLAIHWQRNNKKYAELKQKRFREYIYQFVERHDIKGENGDYYKLKYHSFRHTLGTGMLNKGMEMNEIAEYLGHQSLHSTASYAKLKNPTIQKEYKKLGFIGMIVEDVNKEALGKEKLSETVLKSAALPDGACSKPLDNRGNICANYNMCIICPKFITTPKHLPIHKSHLKRLKGNREGYMASEYIGTQEHLETIESALEVIIERLEEVGSDGV